MKRFLSIHVVLLFSFGCAHVISEDIRSRVDTGVSLQEVFENPVAYRGSVVIIGGTIVGSVNKNDGTYIEVIEKPLNYRGIPRYSDSSYGRFIIVHHGFLETELFSGGRYVTVAGEVIGSRVQKLDEMDYSYLFLKSIEIHLVQPHRRIPVFIGVGVSHSF
jgi:outer membrane lipoprotein